MFYLQRFLGTALYEEHINFQAGCFHPRIVVVFAASTEQVLKLLYTDPQRSDFFDQSANRFGHRPVLFNALLRSYASPTLSLDFPLRQELSGKVNVLVRVPESGVRLLNPKDAIQLGRDGITDFPLHEFFLSPEKDRNRRHNP
jgi:hypothetical protein